MVPSSQVYSDSLGRQTSINDCLSRNIDDLTNSLSASTLCIHSLPYMNLEFGAKHYLHIFHVFERRIPDYCRNSLCLLLKRFVCLKNVSRIARDFKVR